MGRNRPHGDISVGHARCTRRFAYPREIVWARARDRHTAYLLRPGRGERHAGTRSRVRLSWDRQVLGGERVTQSTRLAAWPVRGRQIRPVQARYPVLYPRPGFPGPGSPDLGDARGEIKPVAGGTEQGVGSEWSAYRQSYSRTRARHRKTAPSRGFAAEGSQEPLPDGVPAPAWRVRTQGASTRAIS